MLNALQEFIFQFIRFRLTFRLFSELAKSGFKAPLYRAVAIVKISRRGIGAVLRNRKGETSRALLFG